MATHDLIYDSDAHVYLSRITPESPDLTDDSELPSSTVAQLYQEAPNLAPVLPNVPYVPYVPVYAPSLNPTPNLSKKRPLKAKAYLSNPLTRIIAGIRSQALLLSTMY